MRARALRGEPLGRGVATGRVGDRERAEVAPADTEEPRLRRLGRPLELASHAEALVEDVRRIRTHPLVPSDIPVYGYLFEVATGRLVEVPQATEAGRTTHEAEVGIPG